MNTHPLTRRDLLKSGALCLPALFLPPWKQPHPPQAGDIMRSDLIALPYSTYGSFGSFEDYSAGNIPGYGVASLLPVQSNFGGWTFANPLPISHRRYRLLELVLPILIAVGTNTNPNLPIPSISFSVQVLIGNEIIASEAYTDVPLIQASDGSYLPQQLFLPTDQIITGHEALNIQFQMSNIQGQSIIADLKLGVWGTNQPGGSSPFPPPYAEVQLV